MNIKFTFTYTAHFDIDQAVEDFREMLYWDPDADTDKILYNAVEQNITWPIEVDDLPNEVVETCADALRKRIGGVQMRMELD